jgi:hypothetical protein
VSYQYPGSCPSTDGSAFIGRGKDLARLDEIIAGQRGGLKPTIVAVITGTAGIGKTALCG